MKEDLKSNIINSLVAKGANHPCARCGGKEFEILEESELRFFSNNHNALAGRTSSIAVINVACPNCGHIWQHAIKKL